MGKRKLHGQTYFQCDWSGLPMRQTNCYLPDWTDQGKLLKHGSYACWEAVVAHAQEMFLSMATEKTSDEIQRDSAKFMKIQQYIDDLVGCNVKAAPHWSQLSWFSRNTDEMCIQSPKAFFDECCKLTSPVVAVRIPVNDDVHEVLCDANDIATKFEKHLHPRPFNAGEITPQSFQLVRKRANKDRDLTVFYWPYKNGLTFNYTASNAFKMQIYGDALVLQQTREASFLPRERYVNYSPLNFMEQFSNKHKRKETAPTFSTNEYATAKAEMASQLQTLEATASANASLPAELAKAAVLPPPSGAELAALLRAQGQSPPSKKRGWPFDQPYSPP